MIIISFYFHYYSYDDELKKLIVEEKLDVQQFREKVCLTIFQNEEMKDFLIPSEDDYDNVDIQEWMDNMMTDSFWCDHVFIQLAANYIGRDIIIFQIQKINGHGDDEGKIIIPASESYGKIYLLNYVDTHFQSILPALPEQS